MCCGDLGGMAGLGEGMPDLKSWVVDHMRKLHKPKYEDWTCKQMCAVHAGRYVLMSRITQMFVAAALTVGSTDATFKLLSLLDSGNKKIMCDQYTVQTNSEISTASFTWLVLHN